MFVNDKIIYLQLQKTGCTHIAMLLDSHLGGANEHKHGRLTRDPAGRTVIGSVRNPWDWYVSLWAYGCMGKGAINTRLTDNPAQASLRSVRNSIAHPDKWLKLPNNLLRSIKDNQSNFWRRVYADSNDYGAFREWLHGIHDPIIQNTIFEDSRPMILHQFVGLYTARLVYLYSDITQWNQHAKRITSQDDIETFYNKNKVITQMIRTETIANDLANVMIDIGRSDITFDILAVEGKTNSSERSRFESYYDSSTINLVDQRDQFVVKQFNYIPPKIGLN